MRTFDFSDPSSSYPVCLLLQAEVRPPVGNSTLIRRTLSSSSICLETFSDSAPCCTGALSSSCSERGLRAMGYRGAAVLDWQRQLRWLIAVSFIRDRYHAESRSLFGEFPQIPTRLKLSHGDIQRAARENYSPLASERELSI